MVQTPRDQFMERIAQLADEGKIALFIGAGVSEAANAPSTQKLSQLIREKFPKAKYRTDSLMDVCQGVVDCDFYDGRRELEDFIRSIMLALKPSKWHSELVKYNWKAIFTTNFDDLVEQTYRTIPPKVRRDFYPVLNDQFSVVERSALYIFKLMGTVLARGNDPGRMVLTRTDFIENVKMRTKVAGILYDIIQDGTLVFVGYSGDDQLVFEIMDEVIRENKDVSTKSYMLLRDLKSIEGEEQKLGRRNVIPVQCSFEDLMKFLSERTKPPKSLVPKGQLVRVSNYDIVFSYEEVRPFEGLFRIFNESDFHADPGNRDDFFRGINTSWGAYREKWDFQRDIYEKQDGIRSKVFAELARKGARENKVMLLTGIPGIGKTMIVQRLAFDCYNAGMPVVIFGRSKGIFDYKVLDSMLMELDRKVSQSTGGRLKSAKSLILFDNLESLLFDPTEVASYLGSRGRSALIICTTRDVSLEMGPPFGIPESSVISIPQKLTPTETGKLVEHLIQLAYVASKEVWDAFIREQLEGSFFAAMYTLVDPARRPLGKIIHDQFTKFTDEEKELFFTICAFHRFGLSVNIELLTRSTIKSDYGKFTEVMKDKGFRETIVETEDWEGNVVYSTHNPLIAQRTFSIFMPDRLRQKEFYCQLLGDVRSAIQVERDLVERLLIRNMGPNRNLSDFKDDQLLEIFLKVIEKNPLRSLLHHTGLLYMKKKDFPKSEQMLLKALNTHDRFVEAYRGESTQNILTSLGMMYMEWAQWVKDTQMADAEAIMEGLYRKSEYYLSDAMRSRYPKPHPYHVMARMNLQRGDYCGNDSKRFEYYSKALEVVDLARKTVDESRIRALIEVEIQLRERTKDEKALMEAVDVLEKKYSSSRGYYIYIKTLLANITRLKPSDTKERLSKANGILEKGLKSFPADESLMRLKAEVTKLLYPGDRKRYFDALDQWFAVSKWQEIGLMYDLAVSAFMLGYYPTSFKVFGQLEKRSAGFRDRFSFPQYYVDEKGEKKSFDGTIVRINDPYEGEIRVDSLQNLDRNLRFRIEACRGFVPQETDSVRFWIGFNYVSPECVEIEKT